MRAPQPVPPRPAPDAPRPRWRFILTPPATGAENMALDEALMERAAASGEWVLRVYTWSAPTVSFGRHQLAKGHYDAARLRSLGAGVVRRPTGGPGVPPHREI